MEHEHADHRDYRFPVDVEYVGDLKGTSDPEQDYAIYGRVLSDQEAREAMSEEHALIYADGFVAVTLYEHSYAMWSLNDGLIKGGSCWEKDKYQLASNSIAKIKQPWLGHKEPLWKVRERAAQAINSLPAVDGSYTWKCETCGDEWKELDNTGYDRTKDTSGWPVMCVRCSEDWMKKVNDNRSERDDAGRVPDSGPTIG